MKKMTSEVETLIAWDSIHSWW